MGAVQKAHRVFEKSSVLRRFSLIRTMPAHIPTPLSPTTPFRISPRTPTYHTLFPHVPPTHGLYTSTPHCTHIPAHTHHFHPTPTRTYPTPTTPTPHSRPHPHTPPTCTWPPNTTAPPTALLTPTPRPTHAPPTPHTRPTPHARFPPTHTPTPTAPPTHTPPTPQPPTPQPRPTTTPPTPHRHTTAPPHPARPSSESLPRALTGVGRRIATAKFPQVADANLNMRNNTSCNHDLDFDAAIAIVTCSRCALTQSRACPSTGPLPLAAALMPPAPAAAVFLLRDAADTGTGLRGPATPLKEFLREFILLTHDTSLLFPDNDNLRNMYLYTITAHRSNAATINTSQSTHTAHSQHTQLFLTHQAARHRVRRIFEMKNETRATHVTGLVGSYKGMKNGLSFMTPLPPITVTYRIGRAGIRQMQNVYLHYYTSTLPICYTSSYFRWIVLC
nr:mucin-2-like [Penaeus vannamei]